MLLLHHILLNLLFPFTHSLKIHHLTNPWRYSKFPNEFCCSLIASQLVIGLQYHHELFLLHTSLYFPGYILLQLVFGLCLQVQGFCHVQILKPERIRRIRFIVWASIYIVSGGFSKQRVKTEAILCPFLLFFCGLNDHLVYFHDVTCYLLAYWFPPVLGSIWKAFFSKSWSLYSKGGSNTLV